VGGQALPDGVVMRTSRAWAVARADGSVHSGVIPPSRTARIPVLRVVCGLLVGLRIGFARPKGPRPQGSRTGQFVLALVLTEVAVLALDRAAGELGAPRYAAPLVAGLICLVALVVFRAIAPGPQWSYHGAEHKAVTAYEHGCDLDDVDRVLTYTRLHPRCGTNLVLWVAMAAPFAQRLSLGWQLLAYPLLLGAIAEMLSLAARHPHRLLSRIAVAPGMAIQAAITTTEPTLLQQQVGCRALAACLDQHAAVVDGRVLQFAEG
jgi:uncharacterized protein YqhQ